MNRDLIYFVHSFSLSSLHYLCFLSLSLGECRETDRFVCDHPDFLPIFSSGQL